MNPNDASPEWCEERASDMYGQAMERRFGRAWMDLSLAQCAALSLDLRDMCESEDMLTDQATRELSRRIGGPSALASYADTLLAGHARRARLSARPSPEVA